MVTTQTGLTGDLALGRAEEDINLVAELVRIQAQHRVAKIVQKLDRLLKAKTVELRHVLVSIGIDFTLHFHTYEDEAKFIFISFSVKGSEIISNKVYTFLPALNGFPLHPFLGSTR